MFDNFLDLDRAAFLYLNNLGEGSTDSFWLHITSTWIWLPFYALLLYLLYRIFTWRALLYIVIFAALGVATSDQLAGLFKEGIMRLRPCHDPSLNGLMRVVKCGGPYGFYSAHASNTFFLATFLYRQFPARYRRVSIVLFLWAAVISYSRIYLGVHYPFDVIFGAVMGFLLGGFYSTLVKLVFQNNQNTQ